MGNKERLTTEEESHKEEIRESQNVCKEYRRNSKA